MRFKHQSTKKYGHNSGFSCVFRQPKAVHSHCSLLHGYALAFEFTFGSNELDVRNWVQDFGGMKDVKKFLEQKFDHTVVVDENDPNWKDIMRLGDLGIANVVFLPAVGCEKFAEYAFENVEHILGLDEADSRVKLLSVQVWEHEANSGTYFNPNLG